MELCAQMMRSTSSADVLMAMMVPRSLASEFLLNGNCDDFERAAPDWTVNARTMGEWSDVLLVRPA
jgi:hypothetical protein